MTVTRLRVLSRAQSKLVLLGALFGTVLLIAPTALAARGPLRNDPGRNHDHGFIPTPPGPTNPPGPPPPAPVETFSCTGPLTGDVTGNVDVPLGATCTNSGDFSVSGEVDVEGTFVSLGGVYSASVVVNGGTLRMFHCQSTAICATFGPNSILGELIVKGSAGTSQITANVGGDVEVESNTGPIGIDQSILGGSLKIYDNSDSFTFEAVTIGGNLDCIGNDPPPVNAGFVTVAGTSSGQCAAAPVPPQ